MFQACRVVHTTTPPHPRTPVRTHIETGVERIPRGYTFTPLVSHKGASDGHPPFFFPFFFSSAIGLPASFGAPTPLPFPSTLPFWFFLFDVKALPGGCNARPWGGGLIHDCASVPSCVHPGSVCPAALSLLSRPRHPTPRNSSKKTCKNNPKKHSKREKASGSEQKYTVRAPLRSISAGCESPHSHTTPRVEEGKRWLERRRRRRRRRRQDDELETLHLNHGLFPGSRVQANPRGGVCCSSPSVYDCLLECSSKAITSSANAVLYTRGLVYTAGDWLGGERLETDGRVESAAAA